MYADSGLVRRGAVMNEAFDQARAQRQQVRQRWTQKMLTVLKASRQDADVSRRQLAEWLGMTPGQVANMEHGRRDIRVVDFILIAQAIRVDPETLFRRVLKW